MEKSSLTTPQQRLRLARKKAGLTQDQLAEKLGRHRGTIINWEKPGSSVAFEDFLSASDILEVDVQWLYEGFDPQTHVGGCPPKWLPREYAAWLSREKAIESSRGNEIDELNTKVTILDPTTGSGAFLLDSASLLLKNFQISLLIDPWKILDDIIKSRGMKITEDEHQKIVILASSKAILEKRDPTRKDVLDAMAAVLDME